MSISKTEREPIERVRQRYLNAQRRVFKDVHEGIASPPTDQRYTKDVGLLLNALDAADSEKAELQKENERLNYMLRYIDATAVDRRLTMKASEAWLKKRDREAKRGKE